MNLSNENQLLLCCARTKLDSSTKKQINYLHGNNLSWEIILANSMQEKIAPLIYYNLQQLPVIDKIPQQITSKFKNTYFGVGGRNITIYNELKKLLNLLSQTDIDVIVLKGVSYIETLYHNIALRSMGDIDLLFRENDLPRARELLLNHDYAQHDRWHEHPKIDVHHLVPFRNPENKVLIEAHWSIGMYDQLFNINMEEVWQRTRTIKIDDNNMLILSPEDMILHQCCHLFLIHRGEIFLKNLCDLSEIIQRPDPAINWNLVLDSSKRFEISALVYSGLFLVQQAFNLNIPVHVLKNLKTGCTTRQLSCIENFINKDFIQQNSIKSPLNRLLWFNGFSNKIRYLFSTLFPSMDLIEKRYSLQPNSPIAIFYYLVRPFQLLIKHANSTFKLLISIPGKFFHHLFKWKSNNTNPGFLN